MQRRAARSYSTLPVASPRPAERLIHAQLTGRVASRRAAAASRESLNLSARHGRPSREFAAPERFWRDIVDRGSGAPPRSPMGSYTYQRFRYRTPDELAGGRPKRRPVAIVGAGPVGLSAAIDL